MDKSCHPSAADSTTSNITSIATSSANTTRDHYLRHLNKLSQKISKPISNKKPTTFDSSQAQPQPQPQLQNPTLSIGNNNPVQAQAQQNLQHQPPVYNINKNDFRDVVQRLTGSPAHERISAPPPIQQPKPASTRLQRIRPPPLPQITNRPPPLLNPPPRSQTHPPNAAPFNNFSVFTRPSAPPPAPAPLSPLPPFPTVHASAESPISAYMRDLQNLVDVNTKQFAGFSTLPPPPQTQVQVQPQTQTQTQVQQEQQQQQQGQVLSQVSFPMPTSPVPFGCLNSQLASYPLLSPGLLFSPTSGQLGFPQLPLSPTVPVPSPRWRGI